MSLPTTFPGLLITSAGQGVHAALGELNASDLPAGDVTIRVAYSTLNYKDALALRHGAPVVRKFPMVPGVDLAGTVVTSTDPRFQPGDAVLVNGWGLGENHWGGHAAYARVPGGFALKIPAGLNAAQAMAIGTAGYTSMLCLMALERSGLTPAAGPVLVTGASGGVGSIALALLAARGFQVVASTGKTAEADYLRYMGATEIIDRSTLSAPGKPLQKERWAAAIDSVGGQTLANVCAGLNYRGAVAACGMAQSLDFPASVAPFILRGVTLHGIDSVRAPLAEREIAWARLARELDLGKLAQATREISLAETIATAADLLAGKIRGRVVIRLPGL